MRFIANNVNAQSLRKASGGLLANEGVLQNEVVNGDSTKIGAVFPPS